MKRDKINKQEGRMALSGHILERANKTWEKYGPTIDCEALDKIMADRECLRFPARIEFDSSKIDEGMFAICEPLSDDLNKDGYLVTVHEHFKDRHQELPALVLYHLVCVNYGDFATAADAELFASTIMGMAKDEYYEYLCRIVDTMPDSPPPSSSGCPSHG